MTDFMQAVEIVLANEGGLEQDANDAGGTTNFGISLRFLRSIRPEAVESDIIDMTKPEAIAIYQKYFWEIAPYDKIINQTVCNYIFDTAVDCGAGNAIKISQRACCALYGDSSISCDGILGTKSLDDINHAGKLLLPPLKSERANYYRSVAEKNPADDRFLQGWLNRAYR